MVRTKLRMGAGIVAMAAGGLLLGGCHHNNGSSTDNGTTGTSTPAAAPAPTGTGTGTGALGTATHTMHSAMGMGHSRLNALKSKMPAATTSAEKKAKALVMKAIRYCKAHKTQMTKTTLKKVDALKPKLPANWVSRINSAETVIRAQMAAGNMMGAAHTLGGTATMPAK